MRVKFLQEKPPPVSSSKPPDFPAEQVSLFRDVLRLLNGWEIPYAVSGAFALHEHTGIWRDTKDLDLFVRAADAPRALEEFARAGYRTEMTFPHWLGKVFFENDFIDEPKTVYAFHYLVGHHGLFSLTPVWLLALFGMVLRPSGPLAASRLHRLTPLVLAVGPVSRPPR